MVIFLYHKEKTLLTQKAMTLSMRHLSLLERTTPTPPLSLGGKKTYPTKKREISVVRVNRPGYSGDRFV